MLANGETVIPGIEAAQFPSALTSLMPTIEKGLRSAWVSYWLSRAWIKLKSGEEKQVALP